MADSTSQSQEQPAAQNDGQPKESKKERKERKRREMAQAAQTAGNQTGDPSGKKPPNKPDGSSVEGADKPQKSKAELKAERRAVQEAQRAAKAGKTGKAETGNTTTPSAPKKDFRVPDHLKADDDKAQKRHAKKLERQQIPQRTEVQRKVDMFTHLHQYERVVALTQGILFSSGSIHPATIKLGLQYAEGVICGSNARCIALLAAMKKVIEDYVTPPQKELSRDLDAKIKLNISFLVQCRPLSVSMGNAIKYLKYHVTHSSREVPDSEAKQNLYECIDNFIMEKIMLAGEAIKNYANDKIVDGDVILVHACSSLILKVLSDAHGSGKNFRVVVVDGRPKMEGKEMLRRLVKKGIKCSYVLINGLSYVMQEATKVILGSHAILANGYVMSRVGNSQVALVAKAYNVPVLVCCETYKFCERVQTDSFVVNELGDPDDLVEIDKPTCKLSDWRDIKDLSLLNLVYDVTPPEFVSTVITELGMIPCTSVPVVLRMKQSETTES